MNFFRKKKEKPVKVVEIFEKDGFFHIKPSHGSYEMIYRSARGVYWDSKTETFYFKGEIGCEDAVRIITQALKEEYGIDLCFC